KWISNACRFPRSYFEVIDVEGPVVLVIVQASEQIQRRAGYLRLGIQARKEHDSGLFFGCALQVVQHVVGTNVGEDFTNTRQKQDVEGVRGQLLCNGRHQVAFRVQYPLQQLLELVLTDGRLYFQYLFPDTACVQKFDGQVVKIDLQNLDTLLLKMLG